MEGKESQLRKEVGIDLCDQGHYFPFFTRNHPTHNGLKRCPFCMAIRLNAQEDLAEFGDSVKAVILRKHSE